MNATHALGWALVHFLWQGAAVALLLGTGLALTRNATAQTRYALSLIALGAMLILPLATAISRYDPPAPVSSTFSSTIVNVEPASPSPSPAASVTQDAKVAEPRVDRVAALRELLTPALPWLVIAWVIGVVALSVRLTHGWISAGRLRTAATRPTAESLQQTLSRLAARMRVSRPVQLLESLLIEVPAVIGWLRPVILVPTSALTGLTPQQLEVLLAHELAHVRRHDYVVNVIQSVIETLLFYHPAVWWVSRRVREEREDCCDDLVVQLCGDRRLYATALVEMERLRPAVPRLALAASGGSLVHRVQRLITPETAGHEVFPRWSAGLAAALAVTVALLAAGSDRMAGEPAEPETQTATADTTRMAPDTVLRHPDASQPLTQRWDWARTQARQLNKRAYWIGYLIPRAAWLEHSVYIDRGSEVIGENIRMSGHLYGDFNGLMFRGVRLAPLTGATDSDDIAVLFGFSTDRSGSLTLTQVHVASIYLPMDFRGRTLLWLGRAADSQSIPLVEGLFASTTSKDLREDIVSALGIHGSSDAVVPILVRWLNSREATDVRAQAAEWLGFHPTAAAVSALSRAARSDAAGDVRREAAEALAENTLPAALDSTIAVARTASDPEARREAVEGLGQKTEASALAALVAIAKDDRSEDVQREAVETLGEMPGGRGISALRDIVRTHASPDVRREAVETLGENLETADAIATLKPIATDDPDSDVRRKAIETLGQIAPTAEMVRFLTAIAKDDRSEDAQREAIETLAEIGELGMPAVMDIARTHRSSDVRRAAIEEVAGHLPADQALAFLEQIARRDENSDVQRAAVENLGELHDDRAYRLLVEFARTHPVSDVRREAIETLGETGKTDSVIAILDEVAQKSADQDVAREAIETLAELDDARALARVARIARRSTGEVDLRRAAIEKYAEHASADSAVALLKGILASDAPEDLYSKALESLEQIDAGAGIPALIDAARSHPNREVRADALRRLAESDDPRAQKVFDQTLRRPPP